MSQQLYRGWRLRRNSESLGCLGTHAEDLDRIQRRDFKGRRGEVKLLGEDLEKSEGRHQGGLVSLKASIGAGEHR